MKARLFLCMLSMQSGAVIALAAIAVLLLVASKTSRRAHPDSPPQTPIDSEVMLVQSSNYDRPIGTLSDGSGRVLQLYGRPSCTHRGRFQYHTLAGDNSSVPIELTFRGRRCETDQIGCEEVYTGDQMNASEFGTARPLTVQLYGQ